MFIESCMYKSVLGKIKKLQKKKGTSDTVNRMTDNTMAKRKRTNSDIQNITRKPKDRATRPHLKT